MALAKLLEEKENINDLEKINNPNADRITDLRDDTYATTGENTQIDYVYIIIIIGI